LLVVVAIAAATAQATLVATDLVLRYETAGTGAYTTDGNGKVTSWNDQAGGYNAIDAGESNRPLLATAATPTGKAAVRFDGTDDYLTTGSVADLNGQNLLTAFVVYKHPTAQTGYGYYLNANYSTNPEMWGLAATSSAAYVSGRSGGAWKDTNQATADTSSYHVLTGVWNNTASAVNGYGANALYGFLDGAAFASGPTTGVSDSLETNNWVRLGAAAYGDRLESFINADVAAILVYKNVLDSADRAAVEQYLQATYITGVPEPGSLLILLTGVLGMLAYAWRKRS
jgi:hypothetical protein